MAVSKTKTTAKAKARRLVLSVSPVLYDQLKARAEEEQQAMAFIAHQAIYAYLTSLAMMGAKNGK